MINKWVSGSEISLHLPVTATSTLHTDTIDYVLGADIYNTGEHGTEVRQQPLYKMDTNSEPDPIISWKPFLSVSEFRMFLSSPYTSASPETNGGVTPMFISNMAGYGYNNGHLSRDDQAGNTVTSTKL